MRNDNRIKKMIISALLTAIAVIIPLQFGFLKINFGPFTATVASHVPMFIAMIISPKVGIVVGIGSTLAFAMTSPLVVAVRAASHIIVGYVGGRLFRKYKTLKMPTLITAPIHGILEGLALIPFGIDTWTIILITIFGTIIHHFIDAFISFIIIKSMANSKNNKNIYENFENKFIK